MGNWNYVFLVYSVRIIMDLISKFGPYRFLRKIFRGFPSCPLRELLKK